MAEDKPFDLPTDNVVVVGLFNPAILTPPWVQHWVMPSEPLEPGNTETQLPIGRSAGQPIHRLGSVFWEPTRERLRVWGEPSAVGPFLERVLELLPHTPVAAAGVNFVRLGAMSDELQAHHGGMNRRLAEVLGGDVVQSSNSDTVQRPDGVQLTLKLVIRAEDPGNVMMDFNYHKEAQGADDTERSRDLAAHVSKSEQFHADCTRVMRQLSGA